MNGITSILIGMSHCYIFNDFTMSFHDVDVKISTLNRHPAIVFIDPKTDISITCNLNQDIMAEIFSWITIFQDIHKNYKDMTSASVNINESYKLNIKFYNDDDSRTEITTFDFVAKKQSSNDSIMRIKWISSWKDSFHEELIHNINNNYDNEQPTSMGYKIYINEDDYIVIEDKNSQYTFVMTKVNAKIRFYTELKAALTKIWR